jgi:molybdenum cofactor guanylyltransferase
MNIDAFILIGGRSSRFGTDKAFVEFDGEPLAARAAKTVEAALSPKYLTFVAASDTQFRDRIPFALDRPIVADLKPGFGAWSGLQTALAYARTEWAFVLACDLPFVSDELLQLLTALADESCDAVVPRQPDGRLQPLCAFYRSKQVLAAVEAMIDAGHSLPPLASIVDEITTRCVSPKEYEDLAGAGTFFHNINTPDDLGYN